jgi:hypothetical protein
MKLRRLSTYFPLANLHPCAILKTKGLKFAKMAHKNEIVPHFHKYFEGDQANKLDWAEQLQSEMERAGVVVEGRPVCPVIRPHFITQKQYASLAKNAQALMAVFDRLEAMAVESPEILSRMALMPAEKMLASLEPGYTARGVAAMLRTSVNNGTVRISSCEAGAPVGLAYSEILGGLFEQTRPMKELKKKFGMERVPSAKPMVQAILATWKEFAKAAKRTEKKPVVCIVGHKQQFQSFESAESKLLASLLESAGCPTIVATPEQLEYSAGTLTANGKPVHVVIRRIKLQEFLIRYGLQHALVRAYRDRAICLINSFRSELGDKMAIFDLLTDLEVLAKFPAAERRAIQSFIPWTRLVGARQTTYGEEVIDLPDWIRNHRETLVLRPNDQSDEQQPQFVGAELDSKAWDRAIQAALRNSYVVQEAVPAVEQEFPLLRYGTLEVRKMTVDTQPHMFLGEVHGCASWVSTAAGNFSTVAGIAPTFIVDK